MSEKMTCPVCRSHTSAVYRAVDDGLPCPHCGAPADIIARVDELSRVRADEALRVELATALADLGRVTAERDRLAGIVAGVHAAMGSEGVRFVVGSES